jgi:hypothetical protein
LPQNLEKCRGIDQLPLAACPTTRGRLNQIGQPRLAAKKIFRPVLPIAKIAPPAANFLMDGPSFRHGGFAVANWPRPSRNFSLFHCSGQPPGPFLPALFCGSRRDVPVFEERES